VNSQHWAILQTDNAVLGKQKTPWLKISVKTQQQFINIYTLLLCFDGKFKTLCLLLEFKHNGMSSIKITWFKNLMYSECSMSNLIESLGTKLPMQRKFEHENVIGKRSMGRRKRWENIITRDFKA
jgi:hypothetical protein